MNQLPLISPALALISALAVTPLVIKLAHTYDFLEYPKQQRWHKRPVALMGGIAIYIAWVLGTAIYGFDKLYGILAGGTLMLMVGWADDRYEIGPMAKVAAQLAAGGMLLADGLELGYGMFSGYTIPLTLGWVVLVTNAFNLLDNMDGLAPGVAVVSSAAMGFMAWSLGALPAAVAAWTLSAAAGGFLVFNFHPARIFMGDTGSQFAGFLLAALSLAVPLHVVTASPEVYISLAAALMFVPLYDTLLVIISRLVSGRSPVLGGRDHTSHRLVRSGWTQRQAILILYGLNCWFALLAIAYFYLSYRFYAITLVVSALLLAAFTRYLTRKQNKDGDKKMHIGFMV